MTEKYRIMSNLSDAIPEWHGSPYVINNNLEEVPFQTNGQVFGKGGYSAKDIKEAMEYAKDGYVYQVRTPSQDLYLQYEKPLSQQSQAIQNILKKNNLYNNPNQTGKELYYSLIRNNYKGLDTATAKNSLNNELSMYGIKGTSVSYPDLGNKSEWKITYQPEDVKIVKSVPVQDIKAQLSKPVVSNDTKLRKTLKPSQQTLGQISSNLFTKGVELLKNPNTYKALGRGALEGLAIEEALRRTFVNPWQAMNNPKPDTRSETDKAIMRARFGI